MQTVALIDYGSGNVHSAAKSLERAAREAEVDSRIILTSDTSIIRDADRIVLPGVGAFADCRSGLDAVPGLVETLSEVALHKARPFLGICIGMQLLATRGLEFGETPGLGWVPGDVREIAPCDTSLKVPHMGWNTIEIVRPHALLAGISDGSSGEHAYFVHSFHLEASDKANVIARADYGGAITAAVARDNIVGTQFHPEKSQTLGLRLLANFLKWSV